MKSVSEIKRARKESQLQRVVSQLLLEQTLDDPSLKGIFVNRVELNPKKTVCSVLFYSELGKEHFEKILQHLILYKPSLRSAIAREVPGRYTPDIVFRYDDQLIKQLALENLIESLKD